MTGVPAGFGPPNSATSGGALPGTRGVSEPASPPTPAVPVAGGFGVPNSTTAGGTLPGVRGGPAAGPPSVSELLRVDGFAIVLEQDGERTRYASADTPRKGMTALDVTLEANALGSWSATLPADRELFDWPFAGVTIGHNGERLFHGQLLPVSTSQTGTQVDVSGHGRLFELTSGGIEVSVANCEGWEAINQLWDRIAEWTDGRVRGYAVRPPTGSERRVGDESIEFEGTPMKVAQDVHSQFGYLFVMDHSARAGVVESFRPATQARSAIWRRKDHSVEIDPTSYHNKVVVRGAERPDGGGRYRSEAVAPAEEIEALTNGQIIPHKPAPDEELTSDQACASRAQSKLDELRGKYSVTGSVDATPVGILPGYLYEVPSFSAAVPEAARPVRAGLQKVKHTLIGGPTTQLDFEPDRGLAQALRRANNPARSTGSIQRRQRGLGMGDSIDGDATTAVYSAAYPHPFGSDNV